jgi:hypothetical protein
MTMLKPETSVVVGVSTAALVGFIYQYGLPNMAVVGATDPLDVNVEQGRKRATWTSAAAVALLALLTRDKTVFTIGGLAVVVLDFHARHASSTPPDSDRVMISNADYRPSVDESGVIAADAEEYGT